MSAKNTHKLKKLQSIKSRLEVDLQFKQEQEAKEKARIRDMQAELAKITDELNDLNPNDAVISEHAIIRYLERVLGIDMDLIRERMLDARTRNAINTLGTGYYPIGDGYKLVVKSNVVVSVIGPRRHGN